MKQLMIPDPSLSLLIKVQLQCLGWQSCTDEGSFTRCDFKCTCRGVSFRRWTRHLSRISKEIHDILIHGTNGKECKGALQGTARAKACMMLHLKGLIKNVERRYRETGSETMKAEYETFMLHHTMFSMSRAASETGSFGCNSRRQKYFRSDNTFYRRTLQKFL